MLHHPMAVQLVHKPAVGSSLSVFYSNSQDCIKLSKLYLNFKRTDHDLHQLVSKGARRMEEQTNSRDKSIHFYLLWSPIVRRLVVESDASSCSWASSWTCISLDNQNLRSRIAFSTLHRTVTTVASSGQTVARPSSAVPTLGRLFELLSVEIQLVCNKMAGKRPLKIHCHQQRSILREHRLRKRDISKLNRIITRWFANRYGRDKQSVNTTITINKLKNNSWYQLNKTLWWSF